MKSKGSIRRGKVMKIDTGVLHKEICPGKKLSYMLSYDTLEMIHSLRKQFAKWKEIMKTEEKNIEKIKQSYLLARCSVSANISYSQ